MRDYVIGLFVTGLILGGAYIGTELLAGRQLFAQEPEKNASELIAILEDEKADQQQKLDAILQMGKLEKDLDVVIPILATLSNHPKGVFRQSSTVALADIGKKAVPHLKKYFESELKFDGDNQPTNRRDVVNDRTRACAAIYAIGDSCVVYLPELKEMLKSEDAGIRRCALFALRGMEDSAQLVVDDVIVCLQDEDFNNQCFACRIIDNLGPEAVSAEDELVKILENGMPSVRGWAAVCLGSIGPTENTKENATKMAERLKAASPVEAERILTGLASMGEMASHVQPQIREKMKNWDRYVQVHAAFALWKIDPSDTTAIEKIGELVRSEGYEQDGLNMIARMGEGGLPLLDAVQAHTDSSDPLTRELAAAAIGSMGPAAKSAEGNLRKLLKDSDTMVRYAARKALKRIGVDETESKDDTQADEPSK